MKPEIKRFERAYRPIHEAIATLDVTQGAREAVAEAVADAIEAARLADRGGPHRDYIDHLFRHWAKSPLVPCAGPGDEAYSQPCPDGRMMRAYREMVGPDEGLPVLRCVNCGTAVFVPGYREKTGRGAAA